MQLALADDGARDNRDFILEYRLAGERTATGLTLFQAPAAPDAENFFLALVEPPKRVAPVQINPRDYIFVVDISGSMHGYPLDTAKVLLRHLIDGLRPSDSFNVMLFSGSNRVLSEQSVPATQRQHRARARAPSTAWAAAAAPRSCRRCGASPRCPSRPTCRAA